MTPGLKEKFYDEIDRIEIKGPIGTRLLERCYNVRKLGYYGVCETDKRTGSNWGFCSRSCKVNDRLDDNEPYEEAEFKYFDEAPRGSSFAGSNVFCNS